jgi:hypothetical protein
MIRIQIRLLNTIQYVTGVCHVAPLGADASRHITFGYTMHDRTLRVTPFFSSFRIVLGKVSAEA